MGEGGVQGGRERAGGEGSREGKEGGRKGESAFYFVFKY